MAKDEIEAIVLRRVRQGKSGRLKTKMEPTAETPV